MWTSVIAKYEKVNRTLDLEAKNFASLDKILPVQKYFLILNLKNYIPLRIIRKVFITRQLSIENIKKVTGIKLVSSS